MENITRRGFVKGAGVAGAAVTAASLATVAVAEEAATEEPASEAAEPETGVGLQSISNGKEYAFYEPVPGTVAFEADPIADDAISQTIDCDVAVVGAGISGLATALSAADAGLSVVVFEKRFSFNTRGSEIGCINGEFVTSQGGNFDEEQFFNTAMNDAHYRCDPLMWRAWIANCGTAVDWLLGIMGDQVTPYLNLAEDGSCTSELYGVTNYRDQVRFEEGMEAVGEIMYNEAVARGAQFYFFTPGVQLVTDDAGSVTGIIAKNEEGAYIKANASKGVVLCNGGYENNWELLRKYIPAQDLMAATWRMPVTENTGDGMLMAQAIGAGIDDFPHCIMRDPGGSVKTHLMARALSLPWPRVNEAGKRFVNESVPVNFLANATGAQPGGHDWAVWAAPDLLTLVNTVPYTTSSGSIAKYEPEKVVEELEAAADAYGTIEDLAAATGIDLEGLKQTIAEMQESYEAGEDLQWGSNPGYLTDWSQGPFYAAEEANAPMGTASGLLIDQYSRVLTPDKEPIAGLYAVGNCSGSMFAGTYPHELNGVSHGRCVTFGYMVGQRLAGLVE